MAKSTYHMVHYRRFKRASGGASTTSFEQMCRAALSTANGAGVPLWQRAHDRVFAYPAPEDRQILLNRVADLQTAVFGEMCLVQSNDFQALIERIGRKVQLSDLTTAEIYTLSERSAPDGSHFLRGLLFWLAIGDHLFFVKLNALSSDDMRMYFDWLLNSYTSGLATGQQVQFQAEFDPSVVTGGGGDIRNLRISGKSAPQVAFTIPPDESDQTIIQTTRRVAEKFVQSAMAIPVIEALFGKSKAESLVSSLGPEEYLAVDAEVKVRGKRTAESKAKIREIATEVADMTDVEVRIDGKDGTVRDGDAILRVRMPFTIPNDGSSLLEFDNVADQLQEVYARYVKDGKIRA